MGYTIKNREAAWIDPMDYRVELALAVMELQDWRVDVSIFNLPRCPSRSAMALCLQIHIRLENQIPRYLSGMCRAAGMLRIIRNLSSAKSGSGPYKNK